MTTPDLRTESGSGQHTAADGTPQVQVFDNRTPSGAVMTDESRYSAGATSTSPTIANTNAGFNWSATLIGILVVLAIIVLLMWLF